MLFNHDPSTSTNADTFASIDSNHLPSSQTLYLDLIVLFQTFLNNGKKLCGKAVGFTLFQTILSNQNFSNLLYSQSSHCLFSSFQFVF